MKKVIKGMMFTVICIAAMGIGLITGVKYSELRDIRVTEIESCYFDKRAGGYWTTEVTRDGFGDIVFEDTYFVQTQR